MSNHTKRRRTVGRVMLLGALVALPMTATISYAEAQSVEEAFADEAVTPPAPPEPPVPPVAPDAPLPPEAPEAPEPPDVEVVVDAEGKVHRTVKIVRKDDGTIERDEKVFVIKGGEHIDAEAKEKMRIEMRRELEESKQARAEAMESVRIAMEEMGDIRAITEEALKEATLELQNAEGQQTIVKMRCEGEDIATTKAREDGTNVVMICKSKVMAEALAGLKEARAELAQDPDLDDDMRAEVLRTLDRQIDNWDS